jgi:hypothetical protein
MAEKPEIPHCYFGRILLWEQRVIWIYQFFFKKKRKIEKQKSGLRICRLPFLGWYLNPTIAIQLNRLISYKIIEGIQQLYKAHICRGMNRTGKNEPLL